MRKSQIASMDVIIAVMVFLMMATFIFSQMFDRINQTPLEKVDSEGNVLVARLSTSDDISPSPIVIAKSGRLSRPNLESFVSNAVASQDFYEDIKAQLNLENDFCIHFETENGSLIYPHELMQDENLSGYFFDKNKTFPESVKSFGIGSKKISINGLSCVSAN